MRTSLPQPSFPTAVSKMLKRKHDELTNSAAPPYGTPARTLRLQRLHLDGLLEQSTKSLFRALKVARGFERQKLGRRQKAARAENNDADTARLEAEVAALKGLDLAKTAEIHLYKFLLKTKSIASAPAFPHRVQAAVEASKTRQEVASANVQARLFKSGPAQAAMGEAIKGIRAALGIEELKRNGKKRLRAKDYDNGNQINDTKGAVVPQRETSAGSRTRARDEEGRGGVSGPESLEDDEAVDGEGLDVDDNMYASRLAGPSDEESVESDVEDRNNLDAMSITDEEDPNASSQEDDNALESTTADRPPNPNPKHKRPNPPTAPPNSTTFLPSLSLAGYWSGSDDASSDHDAAAANIQVRKNRMGQQARRALWEKKFGRNANHVRRQGLDGEKDAWGRDKRGKRGDAGRGGRFAKSTGANSEPVVVDRKARAKAKGVAEGPLHPSWEAARKAKEQKKAVPFQGKKVVFD